MSVNPLLQRRRETVASQGEISGKAFIDAVAIEQRRANARDGEALAMSYQGGDDPFNLSVMPGELVFGNCRNSNVFSTYGEPNEYGWTSLAGLCWGDYGATPSIDAMMRDVYFMGVAKTKHEVGSADSTESGFSFTRAGTASVINNGPKDIHAGDLVGWRFIPLSKEEEGYGFNKDHKLNINNRLGTPLTKMLPQLVSFQYHDFKPNLYGAYQLFRKTKSAGGISDANPKEMHAIFSDDDHSVSELSDAQEEAMGYRDGIEGLAILFRRAETLNLPMLDVVFAYHGGKTEENTTEQLKNQIENGMNEEAKLLARNALRVLCAGVAASWYHKSRRIIGKAMNGCRPTETAHLMVGHWRRI